MCTWNYFNKHFNILNILININIYQSLTYRVWQFYVYPRNKYLPCTFYTNVIYQLRCKFRRRKHQQWCRFHFMNESEIISNIRRPISLWIQKDRDYIFFCLKYSAAHELYLVFLKAFEGLHFFVRLSGSSKPSFCRNVNEKIKI